LKRPSSLRLGLIGLASILSGCDYSSSTPPIPANDVLVGPLPSGGGRPDPSSSVVVPSTAETPPEGPDPEILRRREVILGNVIKLMQTAWKNPGGANFSNATDNLNELFEQGFTAADYALSPASHEFLLRRIYEFTGQNPEPLVKGLSSPKFTTPDARHIEDCMLYHAVATRVAGEGDDLTRVRRIFDWIVRSIQLVPPESLSGNGLRQAEARPADVLFRGMAVESGGRWSERGWLFMALCRQIGVDAGLLTFTPRRSMPGASFDAAAARQPVAWICAAVVDKKAYLFDQRIGTEVPGPDGSGVATLEEAIVHPVVLDRLDLPGQSTYGTTSADLAGSASKIGVLIDSSEGYITPRMRLLQGQLRGEYRTILFRDPAEQAANFAEALGRRHGVVRLWDLPVRVGTSLFNDPNFVASTQLSLQFFDNKLPLLFARTAHLRGDLPEAMDKYVTLRKAENGVMNDPKKTPIPPEVQRALDIYATYFLAQGHLDQGRPDRAEGLFRQMLALAPEPGPGRYYYYMLRWGAYTNLGRICEAKGDRAGAIAFYSQADNTTQRHGNLLRARDLVWAHPLDEPVAPLPPAPKDPAATGVKAANR
jgi:Tetratricopeptide repeat